MRKKAKADKPIYLTTNTYGEIRAATGGYLYLHKGIDPSKYPSAISMTIARLWQDSTKIRIDASDLMSPDVGTGAFWTRGIDFLEGKDINKVLQEIDATWNDLKQ